MTKRCSFPPPWVIAAASFGSALMWGTVASAHGEHPHIPGTPDHHEEYEPPPAEPEVTSETLPTEPPAGQGASGASSTPGAAPAAAPPPPDDERTYRPRGIPDTSWRKRIRDNEENGARFVDMGHFLFELRFGPYWPKVDEEEALGGATPYADFFGTGPNFYFGLELDWLPFYIPYVASIGPGFGWGFTTTSAPAKVETTGEDAGSDTSLTIFPMHLSAIVRVDGPLRELSIPLAPYVKLGLGWGLWTASGPSAEAEGSSYGPHLAIGGSIALNAFDESSSMSMREETGIRYAYLWAEWMFNDLGTLGSDTQMHVGTSTAVLGLSVDF